MSDNDRVLPGSTIDADQWSESGFDAWVEALAADSLTDPRNVTFGIESVVIGMASSADGSIYGIDPHTVAGAAWTVTLEDRLALSGEFRPDEAEAYLRERWDTFEAHEYGGVRYFSWDDGQDRACPTEHSSCLVASGSMAVSHMVVTPDLVLLASSTSSIEAMVDAWRGGPSVLDVEGMGSTVATLAEPPNFSATVRQIDGGAIHQAAQDWISSYEFDPTAGAREVPPEELEELATQTVLRTYELGGFGWQAGDESERELGRAVATLVLAHGDPDTAADNAERIGEIIDTGRSVMNLAPWSEQGIGPLTEVHHDGVLAVATLAATPTSFDAVLGRNDIFFASTDA